MDWRDAFILQKGVGTYTGFGFLCEVRDNMGLEF